MIPYQCKEEFSVIRCLCPIGSFLYGTDNVCSACLQVLRDGPSSQPYLVVLVSRAGPIEAGHQVFL